MAATRPNSAETPTFTRNAWVDVCVAAGFLLLYVFIPSRNANYADDSLDWAERLARPEGLINSHHLALNLLRFAWRGVHDGLGFDLAPDRFLALWSAVCGAAGLLALAKLMRRFLAAPLAVAASMACGASAGYWCYAIIGDVYVPAIAFLIIGCERFVAALHADGRRAAAVASLVSAGAFVASILHHQAHAVFVVAFGGASLLLSNPPWRRRLRVALAVTAISGLASLAIYAATFNALPREPGATLRGFIAGYAEHFDARSDQKQLGPKAVVNAAAGQARALLSYNVLFRDPRLSRAIQARFPYRNVYPYPFLVRNLPVALAGLVGAAAVVAGCLVFALAAVAAVSAIRSAGIERLLCGAMIPQAVFFTWWEGISDEFWLWSIPFLIALAMAGAARLRRPGRAAAFALTAALAFSTWFGSVLPFADARNDIDAVNDAWMPSVRAADLVVGWDGIQSGARAHMLQQRIGFAYFNVQRYAAHWTPADSTRLESMLASTLERGGHIWFAPYLRDMPRSNMRFILDQNPGFEHTFPGLLARFETLDTTRVTWQRPRARVPELFEAH